MEEKEQFELEEPTSPYHRRLCWREPKAVWQARTVDGDEELCINEEKRQTVWLGKQVPDETLVE